MRQVSDNELKKRLTFDNPWWEEGNGVDPEVDNYPRRMYFGPFFELVTQTDVKRAVVLMGPRRVGKTVMIQHTVQSLIDLGTPPENIFYVSVDNPLFTALDLEKILTLYQEIHDHPRRSKGLYVFFDEIQYRKEWEVHLKSLVDSYPGIRFVASGSAAAALKLKSRESGAGRFTDFLLPPLTFNEFLQFRKLESEMYNLDSGIYREFKDIERLNQEFIDYINYGGFPEAIFSSTIQNDLRRFVGNDIIDKVLLRDLPSLYGIQDSQELNQLFSVLTYNTGNEVSLEGLSKASGVTKNTLKKYLDYLEAAFLIQRIHRIDQNARRFKRVTTFKVYLTNPSLRAALYGAVGPDDEAMGGLVETAVMAQLAHSSLIELIYYARWRKGEVDLVGMHLDGEIWQVTEIKWSDKSLNDFSRISGLLDFAKRNKISDVSVACRSAFAVKSYDGVSVLFRPVADLAYFLGRSSEEDLQKGINPRTYEPYRSSPN
jgi:hypothetical protein